MQKVLVTGGAGTLGRLVTTQLSEADIMFRTRKVFMSMLEKN